MKIENWGKRVLLGLGSQVLKKALSKPVSTNYMSDIMHHLTTQSITQSLN